MQFLVDHIWLVLIVLLLIWLTDRMMSRFGDKTGGGNHFENATRLNEQIRRMEDGDFTDKDLELLLPNQRVLAVQLVKEKYAMSLGEAQDYVARIMLNMGINATSIGLVGENRLAAVDVPEAEEMISDRRTGVAEAKSTQLAANVGHDEKTHTNDASEGRKSGQV